MRIPNVPVMVMPPVYELPLGMWRWCKLDEVCEIVPGLSRIGGHEFTLTPERLVRNFAGLAKPNGPNIGGKKFRYSVDGKNLWAKDVPTDQHNPGFPPHHDFVLDVGVPYPKGLFVPEGWVLDTLKAIRRGAKAVADYGDLKFGYLPSGEPIVFESSSKGMALVRLPDKILDI